LRFEIYLEIGNWDLEFIWKLEIEIWNLFGNWDLEFI
jgi:hypothetical protein